MHDPCRHMPPSVEGGSDAKGRDVILLSPEDWLSSWNYHETSGNFDILLGMN
jgi:hypothetical protein